MTLDVNLGFALVAASQNQKELTINNALVQLSASHNSELAVTFSSNLRTLTADEFTGYGYFVMGSISATGTLTLPASPRRFALNNVTNSTHPVVVKTPGTVSARGTLAASAVGDFYCDGTNVVADTAASSVTARDVGAISVPWGPGSVVQDGTYEIMYKLPYAGTITSMDYYAGTGSFSVALKLNGTNITGLSAVSVASSTPANTAASAANTFAASARLTAVITGTTGSPTPAMLFVNVTWS